jgi:uncharacterized protein YjbI with pentapeptide repeats
VKRKPRDPDVPEELEESDGTGERVEEARVSDGAPAGRVIRSRLEAGRLASPWMTDVVAARVDGANARLRGAEWERVRFVACRMTGIDLPEADLRDVVFQGCKLNLANFRSARMERVAFDDCVLDEADFAGAAIADARFAGSQLRRVPFDGARLLRADFRGAELIPFGDAAALRGAIIDRVQLIDLARPLAESAGIVIADDG